MAEEYNEGDVRNVADNLVKSIDAARDGVGAEDIATAYGLMQSIAAAANEAKDTDAFVLHLISELANIAGDRRVDPPQTE